MKKKNSCKVKLFIDEENTPLVELETPVQFELDTSKLADGNHKLKIVSQSSTGKEGVREINFSVRNGPAIDVEGLQEKQVVDGTIPLMVNAYYKGDLKDFVIEGSETPKSVPTWMWIGIIAFFGWAAYFLITYYRI